ncbi:CinA family protein [Kiloniella sp. b19]|uniref:CinA family protein n=1 Tax=Kiloniella sp. GXU_MW_B19 TaxID=3141326 RepID=UPI0031D8067F
MSGKNEQDHSCFFQYDLFEKAGELLVLCKDRRLVIATAESCTGGLISSALTEVSGSSAVVDRAFITYSNEAKNEMLSVPLSLIEARGAVSTEVAEQMARGALQHSRASLSVAVTGIAGPGGGSEEKPVGLVHLATARRDATGDITVHSCHEVFAGNRSQVRQSTVIKALCLLKQAAEKA